MVLLDFTGISSVAGQQVDFVLIFTGCDVSNMLFVRP